MSLRVTTDDHAPAGSPDAARLRWQGILTPADRDWCRREGMALGFDPVQGGWVVMPDRGYADDLPEADAPLSHAAGLSLRPWAMGDLPVYHALLDDPAVWQYLPEPFPDPLTTDMAADLIALSAMSDRHAVRAVVSEGRPVGQVRLEFGNDPAEAELSYWLGRNQWGRGIGRRMVAKSVAWARTEFPQVARLTARVRPTNAASARVLLAAGFGCEGQRGGWDLYGLTLHRA
ncbi:MAG: GNAT family N-acetyltransferase [Paracoccaceae bacterium]|nr:MAG: GNAT family N-acetyltransferase [Paracoccaceae bacterium]